VQVEAIQNQGRGRYTGRGATGQLGLEVHEAKKGGWATGVGEEIPVTAGAPGSMIEVRERGGWSSGQVAAKPQLKSRRQG